MKFIQNKKILASLTAFTLLFIIVLPIIALATDPDDGKDKSLVRCGNTVVNGVLKNPCDFTDFVALIERIINWIISIAGIIFTISAVYGGFLYMTSGTSLGDKEKAKKILSNTLLGFVLILCSWLIVFTLLKYLVGEDSDILRFLK
jgi:hypothetical protein